jgi:hypothetical protein
MASQLVAGQAVSLEQTACAGQDEMALKRETASAYRSEGLLSGSFSGHAFHQPLSPAVSQSFPPQGEVLPHE